MKASEYIVPNAGLRELLAVVVGLSLALSLLAVRYVGRTTDFADAAAVGAHTVSIFASRGGYPIHCQPGSEFENCLKGIDARRVKRQVIWFGNSQLHAINRYHQGGQTAPDILSAALAQRGVDLVTFSQGNANLQEHYAMFEYLRLRVPLKQIILPVVFDDFREDGLRQEVADLFRDEKYRIFISQNEFGRGFAQKYGPHKGEESSQQAVSPQDYVEAKLNGALVQTLPIWAARPEIRGDIFVGLYRLRNTVFGITPGTKRKIIPGRYVENMAALEALLKSASNVGISVLLYVAPVGINHGERPYVESEYQHFKSDVQTVTKRYGAEYQNLEDLISQALWGEKDSTNAGKTAEFDFMHFTSAGHVVLADRIDKLLRDRESIDRSKQQ